MSISGHTPSNTHQHSSLGAEILKKQRIRGRERRKEREDVTGVQVWETQRVSKAFSLARRSPCSRPTRLWQRFLRGSLPLCPCSVPSFAQTRVGAPLAAPIPRGSGQRRGKAEGLWETREMGRGAGMGGEAGMGGGAGPVASALPRQRGGAANGRARRPWMRGAMAPPGGRDGVRQRHRRFLPAGGTWEPPPPALAPAAEAKPRGLTHGRRLRPHTPPRNPQRFASYSFIAAGLCRAMPEQNAGVNGVLLSSQISINPLGTKRPRVKSFAFSHKFTVLLASHRLPPVLPRTAFQRVQALTCSL